MKKTRALLAILLGMAMTLPALADAIEDGNAGLDALNKGDYAGAIRLFTHALKTGQLKGGDKEFAFLNRGKAYLATQQYSKATADLKAAVKLAPDDSEAAEALAQAQAGKPAQVAAAAPASTLHKGSGWGLLASFPGKYFWVQRRGHNRQVAHFTWGTPQQVLLYTISSKDGVDMAGEYRLDPATSVLMEASADDGGALAYSTATTTPDSETEYSFVNNMPIMAITQRAADGSFVTTTRAEVNGSWRDLATASITEATQADVRSAGYLKDEN